MPFRSIKKHFSNFIKRIYAFINIFSCVSCFFLLNSTISINKSLQSLSASNKGYLDHKTKTLQNLQSHLKHRLRTFLLWRKLMFPSQDIHVLAFLSIPLFTKSVSINIWDRVHFLIYLWNHNSLSHQTWPIDRYKQGN